MSAGHFEIPVGEARFSTHRKYGCRVQVRQEDPRKDLSGEKQEVITKAGKRKVRLTKRIARGTTEMPSLYAFGSQTKEEE